MNYSITNKMRRHTPADTGSDEYLFHGKHKYQQFYKIDPAFIMLKTSCTAPVALCCATVLTSLLERYNRNNGEPFYHSAEQIRASVLPFCTVRQIQQYMRLLEKTEIVTRFYGPGRVSVWSVNSKLLDKYRDQYLARLDA